MVDISEKRFAQTSRFFGLSQSSRFCILVEIVFLMARSVSLVPPVDAFERSDHQQLKTALCPLPFRMMVSGGNCGVDARK